MTVVLVATAIAIVLFELATWLEGVSVLPSSVSATGGPPSLGQVARDTEVRTMRATASCEQVEQEMRALVDESRECNSDADCVVFDYGYPIECLTSVAKNHISALRTNFQRYHDSCEFRVYYDCPTGEADRQPVCRDNRCEVELITIDSLRDNTLDYLGEDQ